MTERKATAWEIVSDEEQVVVLRRLLDVHPELRAEANQVVLTMLEGVDRSGVADEVAWALDSVSTAEVGARSGRQRGRGYIDPSEAAWELLAAALDPFVVRLRQLVDIGLREAATEVGAGVLLGLSQASGDDECAIFFEPDFAAEQAAEVLACMQDAGLDVEGLSDLD
jgi:hypothetical protein